MKKFMRIALVFALAGATLVGCTKDYSGDISDLNKKVSEQSAAVTALQNAVSNAQTAADAAAQKAAEALAEAQKKATPADVQAAEERVNAKINDLVSGDVKALKDAVAALEEIKADGRLTDLETAIKDFVTKAELAQELATLKDELTAAIAAGDKENADAIDDLEGRFNELLAKVEGNFSVTAIKETATYAFAKWAPQTDKTHVGWFNKLAEEFPELAEIKKGDEITMFGALPFIVNPSTVVFDDTYTFSLVGKTGEDTGIFLGNPTPGYAVKAGSNVWNVEVQSPAFDGQGKKYGTFENLALVVENADGISAQTAFEYSVYAYQNGGTIFKLGTPKFESVQYHDEAYFDGDVIDLDDLKVLGTEDEGHFAGPFYWRRWIVDNESAPLYEDYFIIEATDAAQIEKYGVSVEGTKVTIAKGPEAGDRPATLNFTITAIGVNGQTDQKDFVLGIWPAAIEANAELADKDITLATKDNYIKYDVADFGFSALEWKEAFDALRVRGTVTAESKNYDFDENLIFFGKDGKESTSRTYSDITAFGFKLDQTKVIPGTYDITITDGMVFKGVGTLVVSNPEACPVKLAEFLCDADGVLQIVGDVKGGDISYNIVTKKALVYKTTEATIVPGSFVDDDAVYSDDTKWIDEDGVFSIPVASSTQNLLYTPRNFSVKYGWFGNNANPGVFEFTAQAVSAVYTSDGSNITIDDTKTTAYFNPNADEGESNTIDLTKVLKSGKYVAGEKKGGEFTSFFGYAGGYSLITKAAKAKNYNDVYKTVSENIINENGDYLKIDPELAHKADLISSTAYEQLLKLLDRNYTISADSWRKVVAAFYRYYENATTLASETGTSPSDSRFVGNHPYLRIRETPETEDADGLKELPEVGTTDYYLLQIFDQIGSSVLYEATSIFEYKYYNYSAPVTRTSEIAANPTFKFDTVEYGPYVKEFDGTTITADDTKAGQSDVTIPVTAEIKDIWGMTTKKTFNVVIKVK